MQTKERNMFGCSPCPKCRSTFRAPYRMHKGTEAPDGMLFVVCDDCGFFQAVREALIFGDD